MHSYVCGINLRSESSFVLPDYISRKIGVSEFDRNVFYRAKSKYDLMRILSELVFIPQTQESICCCMAFPSFDFLHRAVVFNIQPDVEHSSVW